MSEQGSTVEELSQEDKLRFHIRSLHIGKYLILEALDLQFQVPEDGENVVNVIAGVNGAGKTTVLLLLCQAFQGASSSLFKDSGVSIELGNGLRVWYESNADCFLHSPTFEKNNEHVSIVGKFYKNSNVYQEGKDSSPKMIYLPAFIDLGYRQLSTLNQQYQFLNTVDKGSMLGQAEYFINQFVISRERASHQSDPKAREQEAIDQFNGYFHDTDFVTRLAGLDTRTNRPLFKTVTGETVYIDQLSDGEKQLYGRVVSLMILNPQNSLILIDEPEISLHPKWQQTIMQIYANIGKGNQFIVATHSPQIIANIPWQQITALVKREGKIVPVRLDHPPSGVDVNTVLSEVMGAPEIPRSDHQQLYQMYRQHIESGSEESEEARVLLQQILDRESGDSQFLQEMALLKAMRKIS